MTHLRGMIVRLKTKEHPYAGTDDHIYIGVVGKHGGREFPLDVKRFNDFEKGTDILYWLGTVWDGTVLARAKRPNQSSPGGRNDPSWFRIHLDDVKYVYIRKAGDRSSSGDDAFKFDLVEVTLYGANPISKTFSTTEDLWLANEYGLQAWLTEE